MNIYSVVTTILWVVLGFLSYYFKTKVELVEKAKDAINYAETEFTESKAGGEKMEFCVKYLSDLVPAPFKVIFSETVIREILQATFDKIEEFATKQLDKVVNKIGGKDGEAENQ